MKWKFRRNVVIYVAYRGGISQLLLSEVFDLHRSMIAKILKSLRPRDDSAPTPIPPPPPLPPNATVGMQWRFRRNFVIHVTHRGGISGRLLSDIFDLPRSRIAGIIKKFDNYNSKYNSTS
jgi:hypothetical protein